MDLPKVYTVDDFRGSYLDGIVPSGVNFLTMGVVVESGIEGDIERPERLVLEILGVDDFQRTWSVCYKIFKGSIRDADSGAWKELFDFIKFRNYPFNIGLVDAGDGLTCDVVYEWCAKFRYVFPCQHHSSLRLILTRYEKANFKNSTLYKISTNYYKKVIYDRLKINRGKKSQGVQPPGFCDFPRDREESYFFSLTADEHRSDGNFYHNGRNNDALSLRVLTLCARDIIIDLVTRDTPDREE